MPNSHEAGKPPVPGSPGNREPVHSSLPRGVTAENPVREHEHSQAGSRGFHGRCPALASATAVAVPSGKRPSSSLAQAAPAAAFPGELRRVAVRNPGVCAKKRGVVSALGCQYCELSSWLSLFLLFKRQRTNKKK